MFGEEVADYTYPQPTIEGWAKAEISALVAALVTFRRLVEVEDGKTIKSETLSRDLVAFDEGNIGGYQLPARVLAQDEITRLRNECSEKLKDSSVRAVIDQFVRFCTLLSKPENHIFALSAQYAEKSVPMRTVSDMTNEMARELTNLPRFVAYAKVIEERNGKQETVKKKIETLPLSRVANNLAAMM